VGLLFLDVLWFGCAAVGLCLQKQLNCFLLFFVALRWFLGALVFDVCGTGDVLSVL